MLDNFERMAARLPLIGTPITAARQRSFGDFYRGTRALVSDNAGIILVDDRSPALVALALGAWQEFLKRIAAAAA
jgi:hypothetical protein